MAVTTQQGMVEPIEKEKKVKLIQVSGSDNCTHGHLVNLGDDYGGNDFFKCNDCGAVLVKKGFLS